MTAAKANQGFSVSAHKAGTNVSEFKAMNAKGFVRVSTKSKTEIEGRWLMKVQVIQGLSPEEIQAKFALPNVSNKITDANIPNGTVLRSRIAGANNRGAGGGVQYEIMRGRVGFGDVRSLEPVLSPMIEAVPIEPIEPIIPEIISSNELYSRSK